MISVQLPDGSRREFPAPLSVGDVATSIGAGLAKAALGGKVDGQLVDLSHVIDKDAQLAIVTDKDADGLALIRHSTAHLLAYAVKSLYPDAQVTIGPVIENGFYYDFAYKRPFTPDDLAAIEAKMAELAKKDEKVQRRVLPRDEAVAHFKAMGEAYKAEIIESIPADQDVSLYAEGAFEDLCRGPHVPSLFAMIAIVRRLGGYSIQRTLCTSKYTTRWIVVVCPLSTSLRHFTCNNIF